MRLTFAVLCSCREFASPFVSSCTTRFPLCASFEFLIVVFVFLSPHHVTPVTLFAGTSVCQGFAIRVAQRRPCRECTDGLMLVHQLFVLTHSRAPGSMVLQTCLEHRGRCPSQAHEGANELTPFKSMRASGLWSAAQLQAKAVVHTPARTRHVLLQIFATRACFSDGLCALVSTMFRQSSILL